MVHGGGHHHSSGGGGGGGGGGGDRHHHYHSNISSSSGWGWGGHRHHHHHYHSSWDRGWESSGWGWGWNQPPRTQQTVIINNRGFDSSYQRDNGRRHQRQRQQQHQTHFNDGSDAERGSSSCCGRFGCFATMAAVLFLLLTTFSSSSKETWTLNKNETRKVPHKLLEKQISITSLTGVGDGMEVYPMRKHCPKLNGPVVPFDTESRIELSRDDYQYDYFYLNKGSLLDIQVTQESGSFNIYLFHGLEVIQSADVDFDQEAIFKKFSATGGTVQVHVPVKHGGDYVVLYDNASASSGTAHVHVHIDMTSYNLSGLRPMQCQTDGGCNIVFGELGKGCVIIKANDEVTVELKGERNWTWIVFFSCIPLVLAVGCCCCCCRKKRELPSAQDPQQTQTTTTATTNTSEEETEPLVNNSAEESNPPATAPEWNDYSSIPAVPVPTTAQQLAQPSAPLEENDSEPIPIVEAIPVPATKR